MRVLHYVAAADVTLLAAAALRNVRGIGWKMSIVSHVTTLHALVRLCPKYTRRCHPLAQVGFC